ncbi:MAG: hypothetical protein AAGA56_05310, partial [Myxococcota bacterium]
MADPKKPIGSILLKQRAVSSKELAEALRSQRPGDPPLVSRLRDDGLLDDQAALKALSEQTGFPAMDLELVVIRLDDLRLVPRHLAERHSVLPILVKDERMFVAMADPNDERVIHEIELVTGKRLFPYVGLKLALRRTISAAYSFRDCGRQHYAGSRCTEAMLEDAGVSEAEIAAFFDSQRSRTERSVPSPRPPPLPPPRVRRPSRPRLEAPMERRLRPSQAPRRDEKAGEAAVVVDDR